MSTQEIQHLYKILTDLKAQLGEFIGVSKTKDKQFESHIEKDEQWKENMENQLNAIANALLQDQTRDNVEKEAEQKAEKVAEKQEAQIAQIDNKKLLIYLTVLAGVFAILSNIGEVVSFLAKAFTLFAG